VSESPSFYESEAELRHWLVEYHGSARFLWVGFHKVKSSMKGISYAQALDAALCYGWIDGVRKSIDAHRWMIRFSPRKVSSIWSAVNLKRYAELQELGLIEAAGREVFAARNPNNTSKYSFEQSSAALTQEHESIFQTNPAAWEFFSRQPPGYRKVASWWVISAKQEETRLRRLAKLIESSGRSKRLDAFVSPSRSKPPSE
jgi:uncharacterized protein YdeI (YjbR/CyaY-like superfamily)